MSDTIVWIHPDCLTPTHPALVAYPDAPALFVFDDAHLSAQRVSLKRVMFMYECLLEMPVTIRRGDVAAEILDFAAQHGAGHVATSESINPRFAEIAALVRKGLEPAGRLEIMPVPAFVEPRTAPDLKRFSRYWSRVRDLALKK